MIPPIPNLESSQSVLGAKKSRLHVESLLENYVAHSNNHNTLININPYLIPLVYFPLSGSFFTIFCVYLSSFFDIYSHSPPRCPNSHWALELRPLV